MAIGTFWEHPLVSSKSKFCSAGFSHIPDNTWMPDFVEHSGRPTDFRNVCISCSARGMIALTVAKGFSVQDHWTELTFSVQTICFPNKRYCSTKEVRKKTFYKSKLLLFILCAGGLPSECNSIVHLHQPGLYIRWGRQEFGKLCQQVTLPFWQSNSMLGIMRQMLCIQLSKVFSW